MSRSDAILARLERRARLRQAAAAALILYLLFALWQLEAVERLLGADRRIWVALGAMVEWGEPEDRFQHGWRHFALWPHADLWRAMAETAAMAFLGTLMAWSAAIPAGFLAARRLSGQAFVLPVLLALALLVLLPWQSALLPPLILAGAVALLRHGLRARLDPAGRGGLSLLFNILRGVDALVWALIFIRAFGLGPLAGVLAIAITDFGALAKLMSEAVEAADRRQPEALRALGAHRMLVWRWGYGPQLWPGLLSQGLYFFESNTRSATVIGIVGAGGVGLKLRERIDANHWDQVLYVILMVLLVVAVIDTASRRIRLRVLQPSR